MNHHGSRLDTGNFLYPDSRTPFGMNFDWLQIKTTDRAFRDFAFARNTEMRPESRI
jgi:hypothetical protein